MIFFYFDTSLALEGIWAYRWLIQSDTLTAFKARSPAPQRFSGVSRLNAEPCVALMLPNTFFWLICLRLQTYFFVHLMQKIEPCQQTDFFMERVRRASQSMSREELLDVVDSLSKLYSGSKAAADWAVKQAARNMAES